MGTKMLTFTLWPLNKEWWWQHSQFLRYFKLDICSKLSLILKVRYFQDDGGHRSLHCDQRKCGGRQSTSAGGKIFSLFAIVLPLVFMSKWYLHLWWYLSIKMFKCKIYYVFMSKCKIASMMLFNQDIYVKYFSLFTLI